MATLPPSAILEVSLVADIDADGHADTAILGGTPSENAVAFRALLDGAKGAFRDAVLMNAAAALVVADKAATLKDGVEMAKVSIDSGAAKAKIAALVRLTNA